MQRLLKNGMSLVSSLGSPLASLHPGLCPLHTRLPCAEALCTLVRGECTFPQSAQSSKASDFFLVILSQFESIQSRVPCQNQSGTVRQGSTECTLPYSSQLGARKYSHFGDVMAS